MRIVHSCHAKFHHQDLARQLHRLGVLHTFFTGYPRFKLKNLNLSWDKVNPFPWLEVPYYAEPAVGVLKSRLRRKWYGRAMKSSTGTSPAQARVSDAYIALCQAQACARAEPRSIVEASMLWIGVLSHAGTRARLLGR